MEIPIELRPAPRSLKYGGWFESFYHENKKPSENLTYLPIYWTALVHELGSRKPGRKVFKKAMEWLIPKLDPNKLYYTVVMDAYGIDRIAPPNLIVVGPSTGQFHIPLVYKECMDLNLKLSSPKTIDINFIGSIFRHTNPKCIKTRALKVLESDYDAYVNTSGSVRQDTYFKKLRASKYTLAPRGAGPTSFRLYEALACRSTPVYLSDRHMLPFSDEVNWNEFAIIDTKMPTSLPEKDPEAGMAFFKRYCDPKELVHRIDEKISKWI